MIAAGARLVWLTEGDFEMTYAEFHRYARRLWNKAPADSVEAVGSALLEAEHRSPGMGGEPEPLHDLYTPQGAAIVRRNAVLAALSYPREAQS